MYGVTISAPACVHAASAEIGGPASKHVRSQRGLGVGALYPSILVIHDGSKKIFIIIKSGQKDLLQLHYWGFYLHAFMKL